VAPSYHSELILGGARSGKSHHALARARQSDGPVAFLATAQALDAEMRTRIARHRAERPGGFTTVEEPFDIVSACRRLAGRYALALVDCLTLWVSNRILRGDGDDAILSAADELAGLMGERHLSLVLVSNEVGQGVHPPTPVGLRFRDVLGSVNQRVAAAADAVTLMVAGIPLTIKTPIDRVEAGRARPGADDRAPEAP
jgi:adenosylcobinamide kinase / adenosylcobinamide-phosphate guanylyltransferase